MSPSIDFSEVKGLEPIPPGNYLATIVKAEEGVSQKGNPKIDLQWKVVDEEGNFDGRIVFDTLTFTEKALFRVKSTLRAVGFDKDFSGEIDCDDLIGESAMLLVEIEASGQISPDGEPYPPRNRIRKVKAV